MNVRKPYLSLVLAAPLLMLPAGVLGSDADATKNKDITSFGALKPVPAEKAKLEAQAWLKAVGKSDATTQKAFDAVWAKQERSTVDRVADTLAMGDARVAKLLAEARNPTSPAPQEAPELLKDPKATAYFKNNLGLAYAKALSQRRVYEEALETLRLVKPEQVVDPAAYLFHRAVAEHALMLKDDATRSIVRLLDDALDVPERYKMVSILMAFDMQAWKEKDLGSIARKMDNIERRLELARGGPKTQKMQKEVIMRLDEMIKQMENQAQQAAASNSNQCPNGGNPSGGQPNAPQRDSIGGQNTGPGQIDQKKLEVMAKQWGKLPEKERAQAMQEWTRDMPPKFREVIEQYFRKLAASESPPR